MTKGDYVRIQSSTTIMVTAGLQADNVTNKDAHVPDRLKVNPLWPRMTVLIHAGAHWYPSEIAEWPSVKALSNDKVLTIGEFSNTPSENAEEVKSKKEDLNMAAKEVLKHNTVKDIKLSDITK